MLKLVIISIFAIALVMFLIRFLPKWRGYLSSLTRNPIVRALLLRGVWRLLRLLIFRR